jgi:hypothetical protein
LSKKPSVTRSHSLLDPWWSQRRRGVARWMGIPHEDDAARRPRSRVWREVVCGDSPAARA